MLGGFGRQIAAPLTRRVATIRTMFIHQQNNILRQPTLPTSFAALVQRRSFHATAATTMPLHEFRDPVPRAQRMQEPVGRQWSVEELRRKSYSDMHKLW